MAKYEIVHPRTQKKYMWEGENAPTQSQINSIFRYESQDALEGPPRPTVGQEISGPQGGLKEAQIGMGYQMMRPWYAANQIVRDIGKELGLVSQGEVDRYTKQYEADKARYEDWASGTPDRNVFGGVATGRRTGEFVGATAPYAAIPGSLPASTGGRLLYGGFFGGGMGALQPTSEGESRLANTLWGAGIGTTAMGTTNLITKYLGISPLVKSSHDKFEAGIKNIVKNNFAKTIKPSRSAQRTVSLTDNFYDDTTNAVKDIIKNKSNLKFTYDDGSSAVGQLPVSKMEFDVAIKQNMQRVFNEFDALTIKAGEKGAVVDLKPIIEELKKAVSNRVYRNEAEDLVSYAQKQLTKYSKHPFLTPQEAQETIRVLNTRLRAPVSYNDFGRNRVDALIANHMRKQLDETIEGATGKQYQALKNQYKAYKTIEEKVHASVVKDMNRNEKGLIDYSDILSAGQLGQGLIKSDPGYIASATFMKGVQKYYKYLTNPDRKIKNMFEQTEKLMIQRDMVLSGGVPKAMTGATNQAFKQNPKIAVGGSQVSDAPSTMDLLRWMENTYRGGK
jgi:hypothetical protein